MEKSICAAKCNHLVEEKEEEDDDDGGGMDHDDNGDAGDHQDRLYHCHILDVPALR